MAEEQPSVFTKEYVKKVLPLTSEASSISYNYNGTMLAGSSIDGTVRIYNTEKDYEIIKEFKHPKYPSEDLKSIYMIRRTIFSPDGKYFVILSQNHCDFYSMETFEPVFTITDIDAPAENIRTFATVIFDTATPRAAFCMKGCVQILDSANEFKTIEMINIEGLITNVIFLDNKYVIGAWDGPIKIVEAVTHNILGTHNYIEKEQQAQPHLMEMCLFDEKTIVCIYYAHEPEVLSTDDLCLKQTIKLVYPVLFRCKKLSDTRVILSGGLHGWVVANVKTGSVSHAYDAYYDGYADAMFTAFARSFDPNDEYLAVAADNELRVMLTPPHTIDGIRKKVTDYIASNKIHELVGCEFNDDIMTTISISL